jgi:membrane protease YdiL (CAAX protease family)
MSGYIIGARRPSKGRSKLKPELVIASLMAALYALSLLAAGLAGGPYAVLISGLMFAIFLVLAYLARAGALKGLQRPGPLIIVFLGLSLLSLAWESILFLNVANINNADIIMRVAMVGVANAVVSLAIIAGIIYLEKDSLKKIYVTVGDIKSMAPSVGGFAICVLLAAGAAYFLFGGNAIGQDKFIMLVASVLVFSILGGAYEELWFRGLLLSRITPLLGESRGNIYQAAVFGAFEAMMLYAVTSLFADLAVFFIIGAFLGYYWGRSTLKTGSLLGAVLLHAGLYALILLPLLVGIQS